MRDNKIEYLTQYFLTCYLKLLWGINNPVLARILFFHFTPTQKSEPESSYLGLLFLIKGFNWYSDVGGIVCISKRKT